MASKKRNADVHGSPCSHGKRTFKTGQSCWFVGYKKHTLRLWWREHTAAILLLPLISWVTPANVFEGALLVPSLRYCQRRWAWWPKIVVADMRAIRGHGGRACLVDFVLRSQRSVVHVGDPGQTATSPRRSAAPPCWSSAGTARPFRPAQRATPLHGESGPAPRRRTGRAQARAMRNLPRDRAGVPSSPA